MINNLQKTAKKPEPETEPIPEIVQELLIKKANNFKNEMGTLELPKFHDKATVPYQKLSNLYREMRRIPLDKLTEEDKDKIFKQTHETWLNFPPNSMPGPSRKGAEVILGKFLKMEREFNKF